MIMITETTEDHLLRTRIVTVHPPVFSVVTRTARVLSGDQDSLVSARRELVYSPVQEGDE